MSRFRALTFVVLAWLPLLASAADEASVRLRWNDDLLRALGLERNGGDAIDVAVGDGFPADVRAGALRGLVATELHVRGGARFARSAGAPLDWFPHTVRVVPGPDARFDFVGGDGSVLLRGERLMTGVEPDPNRFRVYTGDLRIAPALATLLGRPRAAGLAVAELSLSAPLSSATAATLTRAPGDPNWPGEPVAGVPGAVHEADVFMVQLDLQFSRCSGCDGPEGQDGQLVFTPNTRLSNNHNNGTFVPVVPGDPRGTSAALYTADVPWYTKFAPAPNDPNFAYPYPQHDQHPILVWNLYRVDADGRIVQVGASGAKHAFATENAGAGCDGANGNHVLGRSCTDLYSTGSNDYSLALAPRSEVIPATGQWGRCGSIFDPDCDGVQIANDPNGTFGNRMIVLESDVDIGVHPGATWYVEAWYVVRDDVDVRNTMATQAVTFFWDNGIWYTDHSGFRLGPAVDRFVPAGTATPLARSTELATPEGNVTIAARATALGDGRFRYDYAVMNLDFARAQTTGVESNHTLRVLSSRGFARFSAPRFGGTITQLEFADGDGAAVNDWSATITAEAVTWQAPGVATLDWGRLLRFSFVSTAAPVTGSASLAPWLAGSPGIYTADTIAAGTAVLFANGFE